MLILKLQRRFMSLKVRKWALEWSRKKVFRSLVRAEKLVITGGNS